MAIGFTGERAEAYRVWVLDSMERKVNRVSYISGDIDWNIFQDIPGGGTLTIPRDDEDWSSRRLLVEYVAEHAGERIEYPLMVTLVTKINANEGGETIELEIFDKCVLLVEDCIPNAMGFPAGVRVTDAVAALIASVGESRVSLQDNTATLKVAMTWPAGTAKIRMINDLLAAIGYHAIRVNEHGVFFSQRPPDNPGPAHDFTATGTLAVTDPVIEDERDMFSIPNRVICISTTDGDLDPYVAVVENRDPESPWSIQRRGRVITRVVDDIDAATQDVIDRAAARYLNSSSQVTWRQTFGHLRLKIWLGDHVIGPSGQLAQVVEAQQTLAPGAMTETTIRRMDRLVPVPGVVDEEMVAL